MKQYDEATLRRCAGAPCWMMTVSFFLMRQQYTQNNQDDGDDNGDHLGVVDLCRGALLDDDRFLLLNAAAVHTQNDQDDDDDNGDHDEDNDETNTQANGRSSGIVQCLK